MTALFAALAAIAIGLIAVPFVMAWLIIWGATHHRPDEDEWMDWPPHRPSEQSWGGQRR